MLQSARLSDTLEFSTYFNLILNYEKYTQDKFFKLCIFSQGQIDFWAKNPILSNNESRRTFS